MKSSFLKSANFPYLTLITTAAALVCFAVNRAAEWLQYDRTAIEAGQYWRIISCHWVHWSFDHFIWCSITFALLGTVLERLDRRLFSSTLVLGAVIIPLFSWLTDPGMELYRGLSGLCAALFMAAALWMIQQAVERHDRLAIVLPALAILLFVAKTWIEFRHGQPLFVQDNGLFVPVPSAHLAGAMAGLPAVGYILVIKKIDAAQGFCCRGSANALH